jgi:hypothetical protein
MVKSNRIRSSKEGIRDLSLLGQGWHADSLGKQRVKALVTEHEYVALFVNRRSRNKYMVGLKDNSKKSILTEVDKWDAACVKKANSWYNGSQKVHISLFANNLEFRYPAVQAKLIVLGIEEYFTVPGHSSSNGVAECTMGVVRTMARGMMYAKDLPAEFWVRGIIDIRQIKCWVLVIVLLLS